MENIKLLFCGDFVLKSSSNLSLSPYLVDLFKESTIKVCNFEAPVDNNGESIKKSGPSLSQSKDSPTILENIGFNVIQLANNHIFDYKKEGYDESISQFKNSLLIGAGKFEDAYSLKTINVENKIIGFMSLSQYEFGVLGIDAKSEDYGVAWINHPIVNSKIIEAKKIVDYLFILPHAGVEEIDAPLPEWRNRYKEFIDLGADAVIASHPHVPQGWELYNNKPIFYSLGNFYFDAINSNNPYWNKSLIVLINILEDGRIDFKVENIKFENNKIVEDNSDEIKLHNNTICDLLKDEYKYNEYINNIVLSLWKSYYIYFLRGLHTVNYKSGFKELMKSFYCIFFRKPDIPILINNLRCESHRWTILRALNLLNKS